MPTTYSLAPIRQDPFVLDKKTGKPIMTPDWIRWYISVDRTLSGNLVLANGAFDTLIVNHGSTFSGSTAINGPTTINDSVTFTGSPVFLHDITVNERFGCNGKSPQSSVVSDGTLATVIVALKANGIMS